MAVVLPSGGSLLGRILLVLNNSSFWQGDIIMMSPALLTNSMLTSLELLAIVGGVALIGLGGINFVVSMVSPNLTNFLVLPNPTPYLESELLSSYWLFCTILLNFFNAFPSFLIFLVSCSKLWFTRFAFLPPFLAARKLDFSFCPRPLGVPCAKKEEEQINVVCFVDWD